MDIKIIPSGNICRAEKTIARKIMLYEGTGMIWTYEYSRTGMYPYNASPISIPGFIADIKIFPAFILYGDRLYHNG